MSDALSDPRYGGSRRALTISSLALGMSLGMAWALTDARTAPPPLGNRIHAKGWPISFQLPQGWETDEPDAPESALRSGQIIARNHGESQEPARLIVQFERGLPGLSAYHAAQQSLERLTPRDDPDVGSVESASLGPVAGIGLHAIYATSKGHRDLRLRVATLPSGLSAVVAVLTDGRGGSAAMRNLKAVAESVRFESPQLTRDETAASQRLGYRFDLPARAMIVQDASAYRAAAAVVAEANADAPWQMELWSTWRIPPRSVADLVHDQALHGTLDSDLAESVRTTTLGARAAAYVEMRRGDLARIVWAFELAGGGVGMLRASCIRAYADELAAVCRQVAASATPLPSGSVRPNQAAEAEHGADHVAKTIRDGFAPPGDAEGADARWFLLSLHGEPIGYYVDRTKPARSKSRPEGGGFSGSALFERRDSDGFRYRSRSDWRISVDAQDFELKREDRFHAGHNSATRKWVLRRTRGEPMVEWQTNDAGKKRTARIAVGPNFAADPLFDLVLARCASLETSRRILLQTIDGPRTAACTVACWVGEDESNPPRRGVFTQSDFDASRTFYAFDARGCKERIVLDTGLELAHCDESRVRKELTWFED